jgi:hypothetical protein
MVPQIVPIKIVPATTAWIEKYTCPASNAHKSTAVSLLGLKRHGGIGVVDVRAVDRYDAD